MKKPPKKAPAKAKKAAKPKKAAAKRPVTPKKQKVAAAPKKAAAKKQRAAVVKPPVHPKLTWLLANLKPGRYAGGLLQFSLPGTHAAELEPWLMGRTEGRTSLGRTAFGELLVFRDLRDHAASLGMEDAESACDVAAIDIHYKRMKVLAMSAEEFVEVLDDPEWQRAFLRLPIYEAAKARVGEWEQHECFGFVPALALGGSEQAASVQRVDWRVHQALLLQF